MSGLALKDHLNEQKENTESSAKFIDDLQQQWKSTFKTDKVKGKKAGVPTMHDFSVVPANAIDLAEGNKYVPPNTTLAKDPANGRWRISWKGPLSKLPLLSRSWSSRGEDGEKNALQEVLLAAWTNVTRITGLPCPHKALL